MAHPIETAICNLDCTIAVCDDREVHQAAGEQCDHGFANADDADCTASCQVNVCGDGKVDARGPLHREQCDDGNTVSGDGCSSTCMVE